MNKRDGHPARAYVLSRRQKLVIVLAVIGFPFMLDLLCGLGMLTWYNNAFSRDAWFSFIGSYFPASIIGLLSLYQAYIIQQRDEQFRKLLQKHRFIPSDQAKVNRYKENKIGKYSYYDIASMFERNSRHVKFDDWESGFILEGDIYSTSGIGIRRADVVEVGWEINGKMYVQQDPEKMACMVTRLSQSRQRITIYWLFSDCLEAKNEIEQCMVNGGRHDSCYEISTITVKVQMIDDESIQCNLEMNYVMRTQGDDYQIPSIEENYLCEVM